MEGRIGWTISSTIFLGGCISNLWWRTWRCNDNNPLILNFGLDAPPLVVDAHKLI